MSKWCDNIWTRKKTTDIHIHIFDHSTDAYIFNTYFLTVKRAPTLKRHIYFGQNISNKYFYLIQRNCRYLNWLALTFSRKKTNHSEIVVKLFGFSQEFSFLIDSEVVKFTQLVRLKSKLILSWQSKIRVCILCNTCVFDFLVSVFYLLNNEMFWRWLKYYFWNDISVFAIIV